MASSFFGLYVSRDALQLAQKGLDITNHNMTNIKTEGYTRQRLDIVSVANGKGTLGYNNQIQLAGKGADALGVTQMRDKLLDTQVRKYGSELCDIGARTSVLSDIEDVIDDIENSDMGLGAILGKFKDSFQSFSATGADRQDLSNVAKNAGESVINVLKNYDSRINDVEVYVRKDINDTNGKINAALREIAQLNEQIKTCYVQMNDIYATRSGYMADIDYGPLELKDRINLLCDELSEYMNISVTEEQDGTYTVCFNDKDLVRENKYAKTDIVFTGEQEEENDFVQFFISAPNSEKEWTKCQRELRPDYTDETMKAKITEINLLLDSNDIMDAFQKERELIETYGTDNYDPVFKQNWDEYLPTKTPPIYAIEYMPATKTITNGSMKGLFDMYNGKGCYAETGESKYTITDIGPDSPKIQVEEGNQTRGIKYYQQTIKALALSMEKEFNAIYDEYNTQAGDAAEADYRAANGIGPSDPLTPAQQDEVDALREGVKFRLLDFEDRDNPCVSGLKIADTWENNALRCVHPKVNAAGELDYNYDQLDNVYINKLLSVFDKKHDIGMEPEKYTFEGFVANYGNTVGADLEYELGNFKSTNVMYDLVCGARDEVSGVNMDEEGVNMMNYQKWYNAISRMINALDECLDKLINGTGRVGL